MDRLDYIARHPARLTLSGAPQGYDAWLAAQAAQRRGGPVLFVALDDVQADAACSAIRFFAPAMTVLTTAPTYLFWRCAQPELRVPREFLDALDGRGGRTVAVGPHGSTTPAPTLGKLGVDLVVRGSARRSSPSWRTSWQKARRWTRCRRWPFTGMAIWW